MSGESIRRVPAKELMPQYLAAMEERGSVTVPVSGYSMVPFLAHLKDSVTLCPIDGEISLGDVVLYTREQPDGSKAYVMHRVVGRRRSGWVMCGDAQTEREFGVLRSQMLARASSVQRRGKQCGKGSAAWFFYRHIWRLARPFRRVLLGIWSGVSRFFKRAE